LCSRSEGSGSPDEELLELGDEGVPEVFEHQLGG